MRFGVIGNGWKVPEWVRMAAPTVAAIAGTSLVGVIPVAVVTGTRHLALVAVAAGVPFTLLIIMGGVLALVLPDQADPPEDGGGGPPRPYGPDDPPWWPDFEKAFRRHVTASGAASPDAGPGAPEPERPPVKAAAGL